MLRVDLGAGDVGVDESFDRYARIVRHALDVPVALVSLVERDRQVFVGAVGLEPEYQESRQTPLTHSFCQWVVHDQAPVVTSDARLDERLRDNLAIPDLGVVAYAGHPLRDHTGRIIGSLCAIDTEPREWDEAALQILGDLAAACSTEIAQRSMRTLATRTAQEAESLSRRSAVLLALSQSLSTVRSLAEVAIAVEQVAVEHLGCLRAGLWLTDDGSPSRAADLPLRAFEVGQLNYVAQLSDSWHSAQLNRVLRADDSNPLGEALLSNRPVWFRDRAEQNEVYGHLDLRAQVGEARAFLPLGYAGQNLGAMALIWDHPKELTGDELATITALASYTSQALSRALLLQEQSDALVVLQSALLPRLPDTGELEMAARYRPAAARGQVGGDWYDAVVMPSGATSLMIGDVVGHDIGAAATMGQMRTTLRALAWAVDDPPSRQVLRLEEAMLDLGVEGMATLVYGRIEEPDIDGSRVLRWTNAGHPPPLLVHPDGSARFLEDRAGDLMLGVLPDAHRTDNRTDVPRGSLLLLYTDGLVERRGEDLDQGLTRLRVSATAHAALPSEAFLDQVLHDLHDGELADDVAVLAVRFG
ncbi:GAF domain-containing SpoIIE family protein phosphatase [uncultured Nocardioides sp.]|uniref:GAF domain-containing SpoIIE family protein phosphatase n=1 Tax=uncultured Nocardioides sp. TaxID=198441 RepID=UPI000C4B830F|nr:SpoIIE family protein phosphatase [uncultured Nocardioides sp.]MAO79157.1 stage II sporulation protein E [Nocardioides sp.]